MEIAVEAVFESAMAWGVDVDVRFAETCADTVF
jgi:hypothetical protein